MKLSLEDLNDTSPLGKGDFYPLTKSQIISSTVGFIFYFIFYVVLDTF